MIIDSHQHFWDPRRFDYPWMTSEVEPIRRPFGPDDLQPLLAERGVSNTVVVQATSSVEETRYLLDIAASTAFVAGVVGWIDLTDEGVGETLAELQAARGGSYLAAIRHQVHDETDPRWLTRDDVQRGLRALAAAGLAYDLLVRTRELPSAVRVVADHPDLRFVVDHIAKPPIAEGAIDAWADEMVPLARLDNVYCKLSGMVTEADHTNWSAAQLAPYVHRVMEWFGEDRVMFGSDWPVCLLAATYGEVLDALEHCLGGISKQARNKIYATNAAHIYGLALGAEA